jgi:hypothetical protein
MWLRVGAVVLWVALLGEALAFAPPARPDQGAQVVRLLTGQWSGEEPVVVALFNLMGVWPFVLAAQLAPWLRRRPVPLWPFALGSMALGAFVLLPGLALGGAPQPMARWQGWLTRPAWLGLLALAATALFGFALTGSHAGYAHAFHHESLVHVMTFDFGALWLTSVLVARERGGPWGLALVPILGALAWTWRTRSDPPAGGRG